MMSIRAVYIIKCSLSEKCYIGSTTDFYRRKGDHLNKLRKNRHHSIILQRAFNKHGESAFEFKILEIIKSLNYEDLITREQKYLDIFKPAYNVSQTADHPPGLKGKKLTEIHKKRISDANKGKKNCLGHQHSQESKDLMRLHHNKKSNGPRSIEYKKGVSERFKKWHASLTEEQKKERAKIASKAQAIIKETVCVICLKQFTYHSCGKFIPKTCSSECLKELRKNILHRHKQKHPEKFGINYWATLTEEQKKVVANFQNATILKLKTY